MEIEKRTLCCLEVSSIDYELTESLIDREGAVSHKAITREAKKDVDPSSDLYVFMQGTYLTAAFGFDFVPVYDKYVYDKLRGYCGYTVVAKHDFARGAVLDGLVGIVAPMPNELVTAQNDFSVFLDDKGVQKLMSGPLSFVNHSCAPNSRYLTVKSKPAIHRLKSIKPIKKGDQIDVSYAWGYFGVNNIDCGCPHTDLHGADAFSVRLFGERTRGAKRKKLNDVSGCDFSNIDSGGSDDETPFIRRVAPRCSRSSQGTYRQANDVPVVSSSQGASDGLAESIDAPQVTCVVEMQISSQSDLISSQLTVPDVVRITETAQRLVVLDVSSDESNVDDSDTDVAPNLTQPFRSLLKLPSVPTLSVSQGDPNQDSRLPVMSLPTPARKCPHCDVFVHDSKSHQLYIAHVIRVHPIEITPAWFCLLCPRIFSSIRSLRRHVALPHPSPAPTQIIVEEVISDSFSSELPITAAQPELIRWVFFNKSFFKKLS